MTPLLNQPAPIVDVSGAITDVHELLTVLLAYVIGT